MKSAATLVCGAMLQSFAAVLLVLIMVAKAEARLPNWTERLLGRLAAATLAVSEGSSVGSGSVGSGSVGTGSVGSGSVGSGSVGTTGSVGTGSVGSGSVGTGSVGSGSVGTGSVGSGSVGTGSVSPLVGLFRLVLPVFSR